MLNLYTFTYIQFMAQMVFVGWVVINTNKLIIINALTKRYLQWYGLFTIWALLSLIWTQHPLFDGLTAPVTFIRIFVIGYCILLYLFKTKNIMVVFRSFCYAGVVFILICIITNPISAFGNEAFVSFGAGFVRTSIAEICLNFVLCVYLFYEMRKIGKKEFNFLIVIFLIGIGLTGARKQVFEVLLFVILLVVSSRKVSLDFAKKIMFFAMASVLVCILFPDEMGSKISKFLQMFVGRYGTDSSADGRWTYIIEAIKLSKSKPITGRGIDTFKYYLSSHIVSTRFGDLQPTYSHCNYTEILVSFGIIGIIIWYSYHAKIIRENWAKRKEPVSCALICIIIILLIGDIGAIVYSTHIIMYFYVILLYLSMQEEIHHN